MRATSRQETAHRTHVPTPSERMLLNLITPCAPSGRTPQLKRDLLSDTTSRGNDGLSRDFCSAGPTPDLCPRPPGGGTGDHSHARVPGQRTPLRPSVSLPLAPAP